MRRSLVLVGRAFTVYAIDLSSGTQPEDCPAKNFLPELQQKQPPAYKDLAALISFHAQSGQMRNIQKSRVLRDGILEFKTNHGQGHRLYYYYEPGQITILTHGSAKQKPNELEREIDYAIGLRARLQEEEQ